MTTGLARIGVEINEDRSYRYGVARGEGALEAARQRFPDALAGWPDAVDVLRDRKQ